ncbi:uncharacterized protein LOC127118487 [Lathyrus oleraceus]|uniref:uncharacterized protein LOC127118487 n=1 Tax=Pisum sativum TaxID=3888 RepID=UPI0021CE21CC|nr:uncharacterized protein LOC127118487 [Pisum sativum]
MNHVPIILVDTYYSIHVRTQKKKGTIVCCIPFLHRWFILHLPSKVPFIENKDNLKWSQRIMSLNAEDISWYSRSYVNVKLILSCGDFPNVPLLGTKGGINYNPRLALHQLGYPMVDKPNSKYVEDFVLYEGIGNPELLKKIIKAWGEICIQGRAEMGKKNCIAKEAYTIWVKDKVKEIFLPFPSEPSMSIKPTEFIVNPISDVDKLKGIIKVLEKDNADLRSKLGKISLEKENLRLNLNRKRDKAFQMDNEVQAELYKRRKIGDTLKGTCASLSAKKKQLVETQYQTCKLEIYYKEQIKKLQDQLEVYNKWLKDEQSHVKHLEFTLHRRQSELDRRFEEIRGLKDQAHKDLENTNLLKQGNDHWVRHNGYIQSLLDQKETFLRDLLDASHHTLLHNLLKDAQYWREMHARLTQFVEHAMEDLPELLKEAFAVVFLHNVPWAIFHFIYVCRVIFDRLKLSLL